MKAVELALRSIYRSRPSKDSGASAFHVSHSQGGAEIHFDAESLLDAALFIRRNASFHLRSLSVADLQQMLVRFMSDQINPFRFNWMMMLDGVPLSEQITAEGKIELAQAMAHSPIFVPPEVLFLYPLKVAKVSAPFRSHLFFLLPPEDLPLELTRWYDAEEIKPDRHPPTPMHAGMPLHEVSCWLGIRAPIGQIALRYRNAILGALALLPHPIERYQFSIASMPKGYMSFGERAAFHSGEASTPALSEKLQIGALDHTWLTLLAQKLNSDVDTDRKGILALQYFFRAWVRDPATRVAPLCGALDALFGDRDAANQAMVAAVGSHLGSTFDATRAKRLAKLRAGVLHGGAPNIYEASVYHRYYVEYRRDPIRDLELATARCLQKEIFGEALSERPHTYAEFIRQYTGAIV